MKKLGKELQRAVSRHIVYLNVEFINYIYLYYTEKHIVIFSHSNEDDESLT